MLRNFFWQFVSVLFAIWPSLIMAQTPSYSLKSPDERITLNVMLTDQLYYAVEADGAEVLWYSPLGMTLIHNGQTITLGEQPKAKKDRTELVQESVKPAWGIRSEIPDHYRQLSLDMEGDYQVQFRVYNDGVAYRFLTNLSG
ncbi:MAG: glycoside hydrolase family 97 N-terminal domain-containing protein, partial [Bacteroidota bacterium]